MLEPAFLTLTAWRNAPFPTEVEFGLGLDLTGQRIIMQLRLYDGAAGAPLVSLSSDPTFGDRIEIISIDRYKPETVFAIRLGKGTQEGLPKSEKAGKPITFRHDILAGPITFEELIAYGDYTLMPGVTR